MTRYHSELALIHRRVREWVVLARAHPRPGGRFRKRKPLDCGRARCYTCSPMKLLDDPTMQERRARLNERDGKREPAEGFTF